MRTASIFTILLSCHTSSQSKGLFALAWHGHILLLDADTFAAVAVAVVKFALRVWTGQALNADSTAVRKLPAL